jgi:RecA/RadA recombinase
MAKTKSVTKGGKKSANPPSEKPKSKPMEDAAFYSKLISKMDAKFGLSNGDYSPCVLPTNILSIDYAIGGGIRPGMITISGPEMSAKSTLAMETLAASSLYKIPLVMYNDAESSLDANYYYGISGESLQGREGQAVFYNSNSNLQILYDSMVYIMGRLPDKFYSKEHRMWYYRAERGNKKIMESIESLVKGQTEDKKLSDSKFAYYPTENVYPQAIFVIDSYPSLISEDIIEDERGNKATAKSARLFAEHIPRINGFIKRKSLIVFGINQIREKPMVMYGPSQYEPGGNALKHFSNNRGSLSPRAIPEMWKNSLSKANLIEASVEYEGRMDTYAFKFYRNLKNKYATPYRETLARIWVSNGADLPRGRGFDKAFDAINVLSDMGFAKFGTSKGKMIVKFEDSSPVCRGATIPWLELKAAILYEANPPDFITPYLKANAKAAIARHNIPKIRQVLKAHITKDIQ